MDLPQLLRKLGWLAFGLMWVPFAGIFIGMIGLPSGDYAWSELPILTRTSMVLVGFFTVASMGLLFGAPVVSGLANRSVLSQGVPAKAKVVSISDTGLTVNNNPVVRLALEVHPPGGSIFQAETEKLISRLQVPQFQPDQWVDVKYHPQTRAVAIADEAGQ
ncbi:MAG TPA: hypothetical protein VFI11_08965 [Anaerolineales bacterium]|nr:hypothetical protein [Anaerolineales bacterium]